MPSAALQTQPTSSLPPCVPQVDGEEPTSRTDRSLRTTNPHHLVGQQEHSLETELPRAEVEEVFQARPQQLHHHDVVVPLRPAPPDGGDAHCKTHRRFRAGGSEGPDKPGLARTEALTRAGQAGRCRAEEEGQGREGLVESRPGPGDPHPASSSRASSVGRAPDSKLASGDQHPSVRDGNGVGFTAAWTLGAPRHHVMHWQSQRHRGPRGTTSGHHHPCSQSPREKRERRTSVTSEETGGQKHLARKPRKLNESQEHGPQRTSY